MSELKRLAVMERGLEDAVQCTCRARLDCKWPLSRGGGKAVDGWWDVCASTVDERDSTVVLALADRLAAWWW